MATSIAIFAQIPGVNPNEKVLSDAKKQAKSLAKEGWKIMNGDVEMVKQIDLGMKAAYVMMKGLDGEATTRYILASSVASAPIENMAHKKARVQCEAQIVNSLSIHVEGMVDHIMKNQEAGGTVESKEEVIARMMSSAKGMLTMVKPVMTLVKKDGKNFEVMMQLAYDLEQLDKQYR